MHICIGSNLHRVKSRGRVQDCTDTFKLIYLDLETVYLVIAVSLLARVDDISRQGGVGLDRGHKDTLALDLAPWLTMEPVGLLLANPDFLARQNVDSVPTLKFLDLFHAERRGEQNHVVGFRVGRHALGVGLKNRNVGRLRCAARELN